MMKMLISEIVKAKTGINLTRDAAKYPDSLLYSTADMEDDLFQKDSDASLSLGNAFQETLKEGDLVLGLVNHRAAVVGHGNAGKILKNQFAKCEYDSSSLDPWYFCYYINESEEFRMMLATKLNGSIVKQMTLSSLANLLIVVPQIETQQKIGRLYRSLCRLGYLMKRKQHVIETITRKIIDEKLSKEA